MTITIDHRISNIESGITSAGNALYKTPSGKEIRIVADELRGKIDDLRTRLQSTLYSLDTAYHIIQRVEEG